MTRLTRVLSGALLIAFAGLYGCAGQRSDAALEQASEDFQKVKEDSNVLRIAPKDVIRAGESLARADRLSSYWGSGAMWCITPTSASATAKLPASTPIRH